MLGWTFAPRGDSANGGWTGQTDTFMQPGNNSQRLYYRAGVGEIPGGGWTMIVATFDGSGMAAGTNMYFNGNTTPSAPAYTEDNLAGSILNDEPLRIGMEPMFLGGVFKGEIGFVEIWNEVLDPSYSETRWNNGDPARASGQQMVGDANGDGAVNDDDLSLLLSNWGMDTDWAHGNFNADTTVDDDDLSLLLANWAPNGASGAVPEPMTLGLLTLGGLALIRRRIA